MIATAAESNPSCFSLNPLTDVEETLIPAYIRLVCYTTVIFTTNKLICIQSKYLDHHWGLTKYCVNQFKAPRHRIKKADAQLIHQRLSVAKDFEAMADIPGSRTGEDEFREIEEAILSRPNRYHNSLTITEGSDETPVILSTPPERSNPEPPSLNAPLGLANALRMEIPAGVSRHDALTPSPGGDVALTT